MEAHYLWQNEYHALKNSLKLLTNEALNLCCATFVFLKTNVNRFLKETNIITNQIKFKKIGDDGGVFFIYLEYFMLPLQKSARGGLQNTNNKNKAFKDIN